MTKFLSYRRLLPMLCLFVFSPAQAEEESGTRCRPVDYRASLGLPRNQGDTGWCYAHTSADLLTQKLGVRTSPFDLAITFAFGELEFFGKEDSRTKEFYLRNSGVRARWLQNREEQKELLQEGNVECFQSGVYQYGGLDEVAIFLSNEQGICDERDLPRNGQEIKAAAREIQDYQRVVNRLPREASSSETFQQRIGSWIRERCRVRIQVPATLVPSSLYVADSVAELFKKYPSATERLVAQQKLFTKLDQLLDNGKVVSIGYSAHDVFEQEHVQLLQSARQTFVAFLPGEDSCKNSKPPPPSESDLLADHASVIAARKSDREGRCRYFVRNTYGQSCTGYKKELKERCEKRFGGAWLTKSELASIYGLIWISD